jgi:hypothetical protein
MWNSSDKTKLHVVTISDLGLFLDILHNLDRRAEINLYT